MRAINIFKSQQYQYSYVNNKRNERRFEQLQERLNALHRDMVGWSRENNDPMRQEIFFPMEETFTFHQVIAEEQTQE